MSILGGFFLDNALQQVTGKTPVAKTPVTKKSGDVTVLQSVQLRYKQGTSDKDYHIEVVSDPSQTEYLVKVKYGRHGSKLKEIVKDRSQFRSVADQKFYRLRNEKQRKGYISV
jgi:predicted DNA-binding WGR domain protein